MTHRATYDVLHDYIPHAANNCPVCELIDRFEAEITERDVRIAELEGLLSLGAEGNGLFRSACAEALLSEDT